MPSFVAKIQPLSAQDSYIDGFFIPFFQNYVDDGERSITMSFAWSEMLF